MFCDLEKELDNLIISLKKRGLLVSEKIKTDEFLIEQIKIPYNSSLYRII